jgi:hypothetical protein
VDRHWVTAINTVVMEERQKPSSGAGRWHSARRGSTIWLKL